MKKIKVPYAKMQAEAEAHRARKEEARIFEAENPYYGRILEVTKAVAEYVILIMRS